MLSVSTIPQGLTAKRLISDYLKCLSEFIMKNLENTFDGLISKKDVQWCLTVPVLWDEAAKRQMVDCAEIAGLVQGTLCNDRLASPQTVLIVLEPEAASVYCQRKLKDLTFTKGSRFLVVDVGGGTVDLVMHEKVDDAGMKVKEIACSTGDLCGGVYVDEAFYKFILRKISCFEEFSARYPASALKLQEYIEKVKCSFNGEADSFFTYLEIPAKLAKEWEAYDKARDRRRGKGKYDTLQVSKEDLVSIFSEVVGKILLLIGDQLDANPKVEAILVVGGFPNSPYLMRKIRERFSSAVLRILSPADPGSAVAQGAVAFGAMEAKIMLSRKSRKTYGISAALEYRVEDPIDKKLITTDGRILCDDRFSLYVTKGADLPVDHSVKKVFRPIERRNLQMAIRVYTTSDTNPEFVTDSGMYHRLV